MSMSVKAIEVQGRIDALTDSARKIKATAKHEGRDLTSDEHTEYMIAMEAACELQELMPKASTRKTSGTGSAYTGPGAVVPGQPYDSGSETHMGGTGRAITGNAPRTFAAMFGEATDTGGFKSFDEFLRTITLQQNDDRLMAAAFMGSTGSSGGFLIPTQYGAWLLDKSLESEIVRPRAQIWPMESDTRKVPAWAGSNHSSNLFGGFSAQWLAEGATATQQQGKLRLLEMVAKKLACFTQASNEVVKDGTPLEQQLAIALQLCIGWYLDYAFLQGSGAGEPLGVLNDPALITVAKESGQTASTIVYKNLTKMFSRIHPACLQNALWIANSTAIPQLLELTVAVGTGGSHIPVMTESNGEFRILTRPVIFTEKIPALGAKGDIIFADLSQYAVGLRQEMALEKSNAPGWLQDLTDWRAIVRCDGQGTWQEPVTPKNGDSLSWAVTLAVRS